MITHRPDWIDLLKELTEKNLHTEAAVLFAEHLGDSRHVKRLKIIQQIHEVRGELKNWEIAARTEVINEIKRRYINFDPRLEGLI